MIAAHDDVLSARGPVSTGLIALAIATSFLVCYAGVVTSLVGQWLSNETYTHGFLVPFITAYLLWERRATLRRTTVEPDVAGGAALLGSGLAMLGLGRAGGIVTLEYVSLLVSLFGLVLLLWGRRIVREAFFPLAFLVFMIPVWDIVTNRLHAPFRLLSAQLGSGMLQAMGIPSSIDGPLLKLPSVTLEVAEACSGVNFVVAILALALPQSYLTVQSRSIRLFVAGYAVVIALLANGLRVGMIGVLSYYNNWSTPEQVHGPMHVLQALFVAVVGIAVVCGTIALLARWSPRADTSNQPEAPGDASEGALRLRPRLAFVASATLLAVAFLNAVPASPPVAPRKPLSDFPTNLGGAWVAAEAGARPARRPGADVELQRNYVRSDASSRVVGVHIRYFGSQSQGREAVSEGSLTLERQASRHRLNLGNGGSLEVNELVDSEAGHRRYTLFWYDLNGRTTANGYVGKAWTVWDSMSRRRTNGAVVGVTAWVPAGVSPADVGADVRDVAALTASELDELLPR